MDSLKTIAIIYEAGEEKAYKSVLDKLFGLFCFTFICIDPKTGSGNFSGDSEMSQAIKTKLEFAEELYIINPRGNIAKNLHYFLVYAAHTKKPVWYMYKFCYKDCKHRNKGACALGSEYYFIPGFHKLLPACENYSRIYDNLLSSIEQASDEKYDALQLGPSQPEKDAAMIGSPARPRTKAPKKEEEAVISISE